MNTRYYTLLLLSWLSFTACKQKTDLMNKFQELDNSLQEHTSTTLDKSQHTINKLDSTKISPALIEKIQVFHEETQETIRFIETLKNKLIEHSQVGEGEDSLVDLKNHEVAMHLFLGEHHKGTTDGLAFEKRLNEFTTSANKLYKEIKYSQDSIIISEPHFRHMALDGKDDPQFKHNPEYSKKTFLELAFDHTPMIAALAFLTEKQSRITTQEHEILNLLEKR